MNRTGTLLDKIRTHAYLRRPNAAGTYAVRLIAYFHNTSFSVSPGVRILPERQQHGRKPERLFAPDTLRVIKVHPNADVVNQRLEY